MYQINSYLSSVGVDGIFYRIRKKISVVGKFLNLKLNTRLPTKKPRKLYSDAFREEGRRFKSQIHLIIISRDCSGPIGSNMTCVNLFPQPNLSSKIQAYNKKIA